MNSWILIKRILTWWMQRKPKDCCCNRYWECNGMVRLWCLCIYNCVHRREFLFSSGKSRYSTNTNICSVSNCVLLRPIGGVVFGIIGDKYGRKVVLTSTIILMAFSTLTIGLLPSYDQIGLWAPILLLLARVLQGFQLVGNMQAQ